MSISLKSDDLQLHEKGCPQVLMFQSIQIEGTSCIPGASNDNKVELTLFCLHITTSDRIFQNIIIGEWAKSIGDIKQEREIPHIHCLLFCNKTVIRTVFHPPWTSDRELVIKHQVHRYRDYCLRRNTMGENRCYFNCPQPCREETVKENGRYHFKRGPEATYVNPLPIISSLLCCNHHEETCPAKFSCQRPSFTRCDW